MNYQTVKKGIFCARPNRFIAYVNVDGKEEVCHVKNTGRCRELLIPGATVYLEVAKNPERKTKYDLIAVEKGNVVINMDSQAPNRAFLEWAPNFFGENAKIIPEKTYGKSRFDFYVETEDGNRHFVEVKGVTLERDGVVLFPDAPTERGRKHILELCDCVKNGLIAHLFFVVQMKDVSYFTPNTATDPKFAQALQIAKENGVNIYAVNCDITPDTMKIFNFLEIRF
ncbi:MAG: DNA/RNA nuclease SfsA [Ruminococcaceae bacterium]|nr:DNA/RNA nuclease SfsA [Oscillospiraceae bacterium]